MKTPELNPVLILLGLIVFIVMILLAMTVTPTPTPTPTPTYITVTGSITVPAGMTPDGATVQLYNESNALVGSTTVGESGAFHFESSSTIPGAYTIIATKGDAAGTIQVGLGYGDNNVGVLSLERGSPATK